MSPLSPATVRAAIRDIQDPELGFSIVDLGLVYGVVCEHGAVRITLTLTSPACQRQDWFTAAITERLAALVPRELVSIDFTWEPRWSPQAASPEIQEHFALLGIPLTRS